MPTIAFSDNFMFGSAETAMGRLMSYDANTTDINVQGLLSRGHLGTAAGKACSIAIYKGSVPTDFSTLTTYGSRSSDMMVQWINAVFTNNLSASSPNTNPAVVTSGFVTATASGTATWFRWWTSPAGNSGGNPNWSSESGVYEQILGTVGLPGSGADLEISSTTITSGQLFRVIDLRLQLATSFNY